MIDNISLIVLVMICLIVCLILLRQVYNIEGSHRQDEREKH